MEKGKLQSFSYVEMSLHLAYRALEELKTLYRVRPQNEARLLSIPPFLYYHVSLRYMFAMEYIKLVMIPRNDSNGNSGRNIASLRKLANEIHTQQGEAFTTKFNEVNKIVSDIRESTFFKKMEVDRHQKFAHTDLSHPNPWKIEMLTDQDMLSAELHIDLLGDGLNICESVFDTNFIFKVPDPRTNNFIKFHKEYEEFYFKQIE